MTDLDFTGMDKAKRDAHRVGELTARCSTPTTVLTQTSSTAPTSPPRI